MHNFEQKVKFNWFIFLILLSCLIVIVFGFYKFYYQKHFDFIVEVACDPNIEECTFRDCSNEECPPNNLSIFKRYVLLDSDFKFCENEDCKLVCESNLISCELIPCEESIEFGESCLQPLENDLDDLNLTETENDLSILDNLQKEQDE